MSDPLVVELEPIGGKPPSLNAVGGRGGIRMFHRHKRAWQRLVAEALIATGAMPKQRFQRAVASGAIAFPTNRRRDEGNFRVILEKAMGDALVDDPLIWPGGRYLPDDTPEHFRFDRLHLLHEPELGQPEVRLRLELFEELSA